MRCNLCWRELEGRAISTTFCNVLCTEDVVSIPSNDGACPICDQVLSKSHMKVVVVNPSEELKNMLMTGVSPNILTKSAHRSVMLFIGQNELSKMSMVAVRYWLKCEAMQEKFVQKLHKMPSQCQKWAKKCEMLEQENESLSKDKQECQENFPEKSRQKRELDEMYDQLRSKCESVKGTAIQPVADFYSRNEPNLFSNQTSIMDHTVAVKRDWQLTFETPGPKEDKWPARDEVKMAYPVGRGTCTSEDYLVLKSKAQIISYFPISCGDSSLEPISCSLCLDMNQHADGIQELQEAVLRENSNDNCVFYIALSEVNVDINQQFEKNWSKSHHVIVRDALQCVSELAWDPVFIFCSYLGSSIASFEINQNRREAIYCLDWCKEWFSEDAHGTCIISYTTNDEIFVVADGRSILDADRNHGVEFVNGGNNCKLDVIGDSFVASSSNDSKHCELLIAFCKWKVSILEVPLDIFKIKEIMNEGRESLFGKFDGIVYVFGYSAYSNLVGQQVS